MTHARIAVGGMSCGHCVTAVEAALAELPGVEVDRVTIGLAELRYDPRQSGIDEIRGALADAGYTAGDVTT